MKKNYKDMLLESGSGFMMPFPLRDDEELQTTLGFGLQQHPTGGQKFEHHGVDLLTSGNLSTLLPPVQSSVQVMTVFMKITS